MKHKMVWNYIMKINKISNSLSLDGILSKMVNNHKSLNGAVVFYKTAYQHYVDNCPVECYMMNNM